jgi:hypothetical protein
VKSIWASAAILLAVCFIPVPQSKTVELREKFYFSRSCPRSHWYLDKMNDDSVIVECDYTEDDQ